MRKNRSLWWLLLSTSLAACSYGVNVLDLHEQVEGEATPAAITTQDPQNPNTQPQNPGGNAPSQGCVVYVDSRATAAQPDGESWSSAFPELQAALLAAASRAPCEVWVAGGTYLAFRGTPSSSFELKDGVSVYGGFGGQETSRQQRELDKHPTVLDGQRWVYHVVRAGTSTVLDGFLVQGGVARCAQASGNPCGPDGGVGGGMLLDAESATVSNCVFAHNEAYDGGAIYQVRGTLNLINTRFVDNYAQDGGGLFTEAGETNLSNCSFFNNYASGYGHAIFNQAASFSLLSCTLADSLDTGAELYYQENAGPLRIKNSILWANSSGVYPLSLPNQTVEIAYSAFSRSVPWGSGPGNLVSYPLFVDLASGDLHLSALSPCIDAADGTSAPDRDLEGHPRADCPSVTNSGTGLVPYADMGAFEYQP